MTDPTVERVARALARHRIEFNRKIGGEAWLGNLDDYDEMDDLERRGMNEAAQAALDAMWCNDMDEAPRDEINKLLVWTGNELRLVKWVRGFQNEPGEWHGDTGWSSDRPIPEQWMLPQPPRRG